MASKGSMTEEKYLTTKEMSRRSKFAEGTIRNMVWQGKFTKGVHYVKPTPRKILFIWPAIEAWLLGTPTEDLVPKGGRSESLINI